ncbi:cupin domain-containing protein [Pseudomonas sp. SZMC_28357]|uniref:JmjC domain-containing protein n=1 Tax=Pseudomonas sp. SZMC_28357 TaxID=3074380 RepID=UPI00287192F2|nr:cupin domain-containing protein [Pseudomonas sp. SZMC_28357]MDR9753610.1 cupin domain-containing protein [Pseudomonas sp. SZMC_28357]
MTSFHWCARPWPGVAEVSLFGQLFGGPDFVAEDWAAIRVEHGPLARLPELFRQPLLHSIEALTDRYRGPLSFGRGLRSPQTFDSQANAASLLQLGLTVFLQDLTSTLPGAGEFLRALERELGVVSGSARLSAFASAGDDGVSCHYDAEEVISIQLLGRKTFHVAPMTEIASPYGAQFGPDMVAVENLYEQARDGFPQASGVTFVAHNMQPGSVLYLPRGTWHRTEALEASLSLSIVIRPPVLADALLGWLQPWLLGDARWRSPLYGGAVGHAEPLQTLLGELAMRLADDAATPVLQWQSTPAVEGSELLRVPGSRLAVAPAGPGRARLVVSALDRDWRARVTFDSEVPGGLAGVIEWLETRDSAFDLAVLGLEFPQIAVGDLRQLVEVLVKASALRQLVPR